MSSIIHNSLSYFKVYDISDFPWFNHEIWRELFQTKAEIIDHKRNIKIVAQSFRIIVSVLVLPFVHRTARRIVMDVLACNEDLHHIDMWERDFSVE